MTGGVTVQTELPVPPFTLVLPSSGMAVVGPLPSIHWLTYYLHRRPQDNAFGQRCRVVALRCQAPKAPDASQLAA
jgi:hypothetical protein